MKVHQAGYPSVVALMGSSLSDRQCEFLISHCAGVLLFLDGDKAGEDATAEIAPRLVRRMYVRVIPTPSGKQPDQLTPEEIKLLLGSL
jgi:DNA primase